jgi:hypothetical protein
MVELLYSWLSVANMKEPATFYFQQVHCLDLKRADCLKIFGIRGFILGEAHAFPAVVLFGSITPPPSCYSTFRTSPLFFLISV